MKVNFSISNLRNEVCVYGMNDTMLFSIQGEELCIDFLQMSKTELENFIMNNYHDVFEDLPNNN